MSKIKSIFIAIFVFIIIAILLLQIDDDLDPKAQSMYEQATAHKESEAYLYLLGIEAAVDEKPEVVGKALMASMREAEKKYFAAPYVIQSFEYDGYPSDKKLPLPSLGTCKGKDNNCEHVDKLFSYPFDLGALPAEQKVLLERYEKLIAMKDFNTLALPHIEAVFPAFQYVMKGNSLASLEAISKAKNGNLKEAKKLLLDEISLLRVQLKQADTLVGKMIYTSAISKTLNVLSVLIHKYDSPVEDNIQALSSDERSLVKAMNYEYGFMYNMSKKMDGAPNILSKDGNLPKWVSRIIFKPNMTMNDAFPLLRNVGQDSLLSSKEFALKIANKKPRVKPKAYIRNYTGTILGRIGSPDFNQYIARVFYLDAKIHLFNKTANKAKLPATLSHISSPFDEKKAAYYSEDNKAVCIGGPLPEERRDYRCLRVR